MCLGSVNSDSRYKNAQHMKRVSFEPFPKPKTNLERCMLWKKLCGRPDDQLHQSLIKRHTHYVCVKHFPDGCIDRVSASPYAKSTTSRKRHADRSDTLTPVQPAFKRKIIKSETVDAQITNENLPSQDIVPDNLTHFSSETTNSSNSKMVDSSYQTDKFKTFVDTILSSYKMCFYYTGLPTIELLKFLYEWIEPDAQNTKLWDGDRRHIPGRKGGKRRSKHFEELLLCLVKIRQRYGSQHLSYLFNISISQVCRIFSTWMNLLNQCLKPLLTWPSKDVVKDNLPPSFSKYPNRRAIIDCTEYFDQKPIKPVAQKLTWSNDKHLNTFKQLIAISPNGTITLLCLTSTVAQYMMHLL